MAVTTYGNVIRMTAAADAFTVFNPVKIAGIRWVGATTAGHKCVLTTKSGGSTIAEFIADQANDEREMVVDGGPFPDGVYVDTLDSGVVYVYVE